MSTVALKNMNFMTLGLKYIELIISLDQVRGSSLGIVINALKIALREMNFQTYTG